MHFTRPISVCMAFCLFIKCLILSHNILIGMHNNNAWTHVIIIYHIILNCQALDCMQATPSVIMEDKKLLPWRTMKSWCTATAKLSVQQPGNSSGPRSWQQVKTQTPQNQPGREWKKTNVKTSKSLEGHQQGHSVKQEKQCHHSGVF